MSACIDHWVRLSFCVHYKVAFGLARVANKSVSIVTRAGWGLFVTMSAFGYRKEFCDDSTKCLQVAEVRLAVVEHLISGEVVLVCPGWNSVESVDGPFDCEWPI